MLIEKKKRQASDCFKSYQSSSGAILLPHFRNEETRRLQCGRAVHHGVGGAPLVTWRCSALSRQLSLAAGMGTLSVRCIHPVSLHISVDLPVRVFAYAFGLRWGVVSTLGASHRQSHGFRLTVPRHCLAPLAAAERVPWRLSASVCCCILCNRCNRESSGSLKLNVHAGCCSCCCYCSESFLPDRFTRALMLITAFVRPARVLAKYDHFELRVVENIVSRALFNMET